MATPQLESLVFTDQWVESPATDGVAGGLLHGWWIPHSSSDAPAVLYLHGNSGNISSNRNISVIHGLHRAGFAVLAIDYRGYGRSTMALPNESALYADAQAAWERMLVLAPHARKRLIYGHSLGGAVAIDLERGTLVRILSDYEVTVDAFDHGIYAVFLPNRQHSVKVRVFIDFLVDAFKNRAGSEILQVPDARPRVSDLAALH